MIRWSTVGVATLVAGATLVPGAAHRAAGSTACPTWKMHTIKSGLGILESLLPDGHGGMLLSSSADEAVERLTPSGKVTTVVAASSPGQLVRRGNHKVIFPTGDNTASGLFGKADGTLQVLNLRSKRLTPYATGLTMPNGLAVASDGSAYVTRDLGAGTGITRIAAHGHHAVTTKWAKISDTNGIAINHAGTTMYVDQTFTTAAPIVAISMQHPNQTKQISDLSRIGSPAFKGLDDLIMGPHGILYLPANLAGEVFSFNPRTGQACRIAKGLSDPSAIAIGTGHGWKKGSLFVCGFDGTVRELDRVNR